MRWTKALLILLSAAVLAAPAPVSFGTATAAPVEDYAAREAQATGLAEFTGGWHGVVITLVVVAAVVYLVLWLVDHEEQYHHEPAHPPEPRP